MEIEDLSTFATIDHEREARQGFPEVIFGQGKTAEQVARIGKEIFERSQRLLVTRASEAHFLELQKALPQAEYNALGRTILVNPAPERIPAHYQEASVAIVCAGTSDLPVLLEAEATLKVAGIGKVIRVVDVGVAGIHRLLNRIKDFSEVDVIIVCAGMEGALPSVVGGLTKQPVIAVPTSVGYGASFQGLAALLGMLNSCASGLTVVNIDNGFGAAVAALRIFNAAGFKNKENQ